MKCFIIFLITVFLFISCSSGKDDEQKTVEKTNIVQYKLAKIEKGGVATELTLPAQLAAFEEVSIFPKINGYVKTVLVDIGSVVKQGQLLMILEAPELQEASLQAKERYARTKADFSLDKERYNRLLQASKTAGAISPLDLSTIRAKMEADSAVSNAEKANWQMQQTMMGYLKVTAPFTGVITERNVHPGALVSAASKDRPMLELKQVNHLRLQVDVPEDISGTLSKNDTVSFYVSALQGKKMTGIISRKSMNVSSQYRNERMEIDVPNKEGLLSAGMFANVLLHSKGNPGALYIPKSALVTSTEKRYVIVVRNGKTQKVEVSTGNATAERVEIFGKLKEGEEVISNANDEIPDGITVK